MEPSKGGNVSGLFLVKRPALEAITTHLFKEMNGPCESLDYLLMLDDVAAELADLIILGGKMNEPKIIVYNIDRISRDSMAKAVKDLESAGAKVVVLECWGDPREAMAIMSHADTCRLDWVIKNRAVWEPLGTRNDGSTHSGNWSVETDAYGCSGDVLTPGHFSDPRAAIDQVLGLEKEGK